MENFCSLMEKSFLARLERRARFNNLMATPVDRHTVMIDQMRLPGDYFLKDGRRFTSTVFEQEKGIFIDESDKYIRLDLLTADVYDEKQMKAFLSRHNVKLPTWSAINKIVDNADIINQSLMCIGRTSQFLSKNLKDYWYEGSGKQTPNQKCRLLIIEQGNPVLPYGMGRYRWPTTQPFAIDGIGVVHNNFDEPYKILQNLGNNKYYVLDVTCKAFTMRSWDKKLNGSIMQDGDCLVIKNPMETICENKDHYLLRYVCQFRKITGFYAYEGHKIEKIYCSPEDEE